MQGWLNLDGRAYCKWRETTNVRDWQALSCFKGVKNVPCCYRVQPKSWLSSELFEEWFKEIDWNFGAQKRKIALTIDNCPAHPYVPVLDWVEDVDYPAYMDQGVFRTLKAKYRLLAVKKQISVGLNFSSALTSIFFLWKSYFYGILLIVYFYCQS